MGCMDTASFRIIQIATSKSAISLKRCIYLYACIMCMCVRVIEHRNNRWSRLRLRDRHVSRDVCEDLTFHVKFKTKMWNNWETPHSSLTKLAQTGKKANSEAVWCTQVELKNLEWTRQNWSHAIRRQRLSTRGNVCKQRIFEDAEGCGFQLRR